MPSATLDTQASRHRTPVSDPIPRWAGIAVGVAIVLGLIGAVIIVTVTDDDRVAPVAAAVAGVVGFVFTSLTAGRTLRWLEKVTTCAGRTGEADLD